MDTRATLLLVVIGCGMIGSGARAQEVAAPPRLSRVDASAPLSGGERWVKDNGRWKLQRINYRYLDHANYAARPAPPTTNDDFAEPAHTRLTLRSRWFGSSRPARGWRWGLGWGPGWGYGWGGPSRSPWNTGISPWSPWGYGLGFRWGWGLGGHHHHHR